MSRIIFKEEDKNLEFEVIGYEFENIEKEDDYYDANWLSVNIKYSDSKISFDQIDHCLLSFELLDFIESIEAIIEGKIAKIITEFIEPYLEFSIYKINESYIFDIKFVYDTSGENWKIVSISKDMTLTNLIELNSQFREMYEKFPYRHTENM